MASTDYESEHDEINPGMGDSHAPTGEYYVCDSCHADTHASSAWWRLDLGHCSGHGFNNECTACHKQYDTRRTERCPECRSRDRSKKCGSCKWAYEKVYVCSGCHRTKVVESAVPGVIHVTHRKPVN